MLHQKKLKHPEIFLKHTQLNAMSKKLMHPEILLQLTQLSSHVI